MLCDAGSQAGFCRKMAYVGQLYENLARPVGSAKTKKTAISVTLRVLVRKRFLAFVILRPLR
jgi:hypothetical protein